MWLYLVNSSINKLAQHSVRRLLIVHIHPLSSQLRPETPNKRVEDKPETPYAEPPTGIQTKLDRVPDPTPSAIAQTRHSTRLLQRTSASTLRFLRRGRNGLQDLRRSHCSGRGRHRSLSCSDIEELVEIITGRQEEEILEVMTPATRALGLVGLVEDDNAAAVEQRALVVPVRPHRQALDRGCVFGRDDPYI
jgi:hypothetical protein